MNKISTNTDGEEQRAFWVEGTVWSTVSNWAGQGREEDRMFDQSEQVTVRSVASSR